MLHSLKSYLTYLMDFVRHHQVCNTVCQDFLLYIHKGHVQNFVAQPVNRDNTTTVALPLCLESDR